MPENTKVGLFVCDFEVHGNVPKEAFELFAIAQAKIVGIRGYIMKVADDVYKGQIQGQSELIENFRQLLESAAEYMSAIREIIIKNFKAIKEYTYETFEVRESKSR